MSHQQIRITCHACGHIWNDSLPMLVCRKCLSPDVTVGLALLHWRARQLAEQTRCQVAADLEME